MSYYGVSYFLTPTQVIKLLEEDSGKSISVVLPISPVPVLIDGFEGACSSDNVDILFQGVDPMETEYHPALRQLRWTVNRNRALTFFIKWESDI